jgi:hypothetical protein
MVVPGSRVGSTTGSGVLDVESSPHAARPKAKLKAKGAIMGVKNFLKCITTSFCVFLKYIFYSLFSNK